MCLHVKAFYKNIFIQTRVEGEIYILYRIVSSKVHGTVCGIKNKRLHCGVKDQLSILTCITSVSMCGQELCTVTFMYMKLQNLMTQ
jgi:hypothetical protein